MADKESGDETCDQTRQNPSQGNQASQTPSEESPPQQQNNAGPSPPAPINVSFNTGDNPAGSNNDTSNNVDQPSRGSNYLRYAAIGAGTGLLAAAAAPVVLSAAGFTAGGVAAGSIAAAAQSAFYGGYVASGSTFALLQSAGAAGIGVAGNTAIGGIFGGLGALGARVFGGRSDVIKLLICGCSSEAQVLAGIASFKKDTEVRVLTLNQDDAERWNTALQNNNLKVTFHPRGTEEPTSISSKPKLVTNSPEEAMKGVDMVVFVLPAATHEAFLNRIRPYIEPGTIIVGLPGGAGFVSQVREVLGDVARQCTIMNFEPSPWVCDTTTFGVECEVFGIMENLPGTMQQGDVAPGREPVLTLQYLVTRRL